MKMSDVLLPPYEAVQHESGWFVVQDRESNTIDASCDGGFNEDDAKAAAHAINCHDELVEALKVVSQCLAWQCFGECRGFSEGLESPSAAIESAKAALSKAEGRNESEAEL